MLLIPYKMLNEFNIEINELRDYLAGQDEEIDVIEMLR